MVMKPDDFRLMVTGREDRNREFKASFPWIRESNGETMAKVTKTILAMSNLPDGGHIIIGVEEPASGSTSYRAIGMDAEHLKSYSHDVVADFVRSYAEPYANLNLEIVEVGDAKFVAIAVEGFQEIPVVCKRNYGDILTQGTVYVRPRSGRPCSEPVSNYADMRELIDLAVERGVTKFLRTQGVARKAKEADAQRFKAQANMPFINEDVLPNIKNGGHWEVLIRPTAFDEERLASLSEAKRQLRACQVSFRGSFPIFSDDRLQRGLNFIENPFSSIGLGVQEVWRFYQSGLFLLYRSLSEDWSKSAGLDPAFERGTALSILSTLYFVSEVFEFAARLAQEGIIAPEGYIQINLVGTKGRKLVFWGGDRILFDTYTCNEKELPRSRILTGEEIVAERRDLAFNHFLWIMERFGFDAKPEIFRQDQEKFFKGQI
jgi:hypothetical protein